MNVIFILFCSILVILMQLGFALLESGMLQSKHAVSIIFKNFADFTLGFLAFFFVGYWIFKGFDLSEHPVRILYDSQEVSSENAISLAQLLFQSAFAATAATIFSGAIAGRLRLGYYLFLSVVISGLIYPLVGWLLWDVAKDIGYQDYAGSIVVHATGGAAALAATLLIGSRPLKERVRPSHNLPLATAGVFLLLIGWYGFNMGSITELPTSQNTKELIEIGRVAINTTISATFAMVVTLFLSWKYKIPRLSITLNGLLGGLVGITASPETFHVWYPFVVGGACGWLVFAYSKHIIE